MTRSEGSMTPSSLVQSVVIHKSELWLEQQSYNVPVPSITDWWRQKENRKVMCLCVRLMHKGLRWKVVNTKTTRPLSELHVMWWMRLSKLKFIAGNISVWEACVWCGSGCLSATVPLWQVTFFPSVVCFITMFRQTIAWSRCFWYVKGTTWNLKLITSDGTTLTEPVLLKVKKQRDLWHPLSLWKVHVIVLLSVVHPRDALYRVLRRGPRGTGWGKEGCFGGAKGGGKRELWYCWWEERALAKSWNRR